MLISIFTFVSECLTVKKSGNPWWGLLIPFYSTYVFCKMGKKPKLFWIYLPFQIIAYAILVASMFLYVQMISIAFSYTAGPDISDEIANYLDGLFGDNIAVLLAISAAVILLAIAVSILEIILSVSIAKAFGRSGWFGVGLIFVPVVFWAILAFDSTIEYVRDELPTDDEGYYTAE